MLAHQAIVNMALEPDCSEHFLQVHLLKKNQNKQTQKHIFLFFFW